MKDKMYVCIFEERDAFMYYFYFKTKKKAKKFMKKQIKDHSNDQECYEMLRDARICKVVKTYIRGEEI